MDGAQSEGITHTDTGKSRLNPAYNMKRKLTALSRGYVAALRKHLRQSSRAGLQVAHDLGRRAASLGLETLDVARMHEDALATLEASSGRDGTIRRAQMFFAEVITPIERTHRAALKTNIDLGRLSRTLGRRTVDLAASHRSLKQGIIRRKSAERALKKSGRCNTRLLKKSQHLEGHLRQLTHQVLTRQEDKRKKISRELHDEIAQTLLSINVRLLTLNKEVELNTAGLKNEIASTQRLVEKSAKTLNQFAREFGIHHAS